MGDFVHHNQTFKLTWCSPAIPLTLAWISANCTSAIELTNVGATETKRSLGLSIAVSVANSIPIALPWSFSDSASPGFFLGFALCTALLVFAGILAVVLHIYCRWENALADRQYGLATGKERVDGDEDVRFRYFL